MENASIATSRTHSVLIATLGAEAQVIPIALQLLRQQGEAIEAVVVLHAHPTSPPIATALTRLQADFSLHSEWPPLLLEALPIDDVLTPAELDTFAGRLFDLLRHWIVRQHPIHLLLAGGRKSMAIVATTIAQMTLGPADHVWTLYSEDDLRLSGRSVLQEDDTSRLIPIQLPRLSAAPPLYTQVFHAETPRAALETLALAQERRIRHFVEEELTDAEREVAALVAGEVLTVEEMAARLTKQPKTVTNQLNVIYAKMEAVFGLQPDKGVKREFLRRYVAAYFSTKSGR